MTLSKVLIYAAGRDAGNASMRKGKRKQWNVADWNAAANVVARLMAQAKVDIAANFAQHCEQASVSSSSQ